MVEPVKPDSLPAMAAIHRAAFGPACWTQASLTTLLDTPFTFGFIGAGGFILARAIAGEAEILTLAVLPEQRRQGIATALLAAALAEAARRDTKQVFLEVSQDNLPAITLYSRANFIRSGHRPDYYGPGKSALLLSLRLRPAT